MISSARFTAIAFALASLVSVHRSAAETSASRALYEQGVRLASQKRFLDAQTAFQRALLQDPPVEAYFGLGQVELALGHPCSAVDSYLKYLEVGGTAISLDRRQAVMDHVSQLRRSGASEGICHPEGERGALHLSCDHGAVGAQVDGQAVDLLGPPISVAPGVHRVVFVAKEGAWPALDVEVAGGSATYVQCSPPKPAPGAAPAKTTAPPPQRPSVTKVVGWTVTGTGLGLAAATLAHFFWNQGRRTVWQQQHEQLLEGMASDDALSEHNEMASSIERASRVTVGLAIASGVMTTTGVVLLLIPNKRPAARREADVSSWVLSEQQELALAITPERAFLTWGGAW